MHLIMNGERPWIMQAEDIESEIIWGESTAGPRGLIFCGRQEGDYQLHVLE